MASLSIATSTVTSSSLLSKRLSLLTAHNIILLKPRTHKPFKPLLILHNKNNPVSLIHPSHCGVLFSSEFDGFEGSQDETESETEGLAQQEEGVEVESGVDVMREMETSDEGRLYVGNLPYSITSSDLAEVFQEAGRVASCEVIYDRVTDRSRGFGFVTMVSVEEAKEAIRLFNETQIGGRTVRVNFPEVPKGGERELVGPRIRNSYKGFIDSPHKIYAGNLGWGLTSQGLREAFADLSGFLSAKVIYERDTGRSRGFGFISFETADSAKAALDAMNGVEVEGRPLRLNLAAERAQPVDSTESRELLSSLGA